jgi:hypothetical protein
MKRIFIVMMIIVTVVCFTTKSSGQQKSSGPTLEETLRFIEEKMIKYGMWVTELRDPNWKDYDHWYHEILSVDYDSANCTIEIEYLQDLDGGKYNRSGSQPKKIKRNLKNMNLSNIKVKENCLDALLHKEFVSGTRCSYSFGLGIDISDEELAGRLANALRNAVESCGGKQDPF